MKILFLAWLYFLISSCMAQSGTGSEERIKELDAYWAEVSRSVREGDFQGYKATCHEEGVLVSGTNNSSYPLSDALARWKKDFTATKEGKIKASVEFRFSQRIGDTTTAHETGIFLYSSGDPGENSKDEYIHFQALLVKRKGSWKIMMEYQKSKASQAEWNELAEK
ncbi:MAG: hypothetical protein VX269_05340 [Verrucomicrobiota bacterium]|nr:hypothetical protein [Verrucomicrobiota bacterium]